MRSPEVSENRMGTFGHLGRRRTQFTTPQYTGKSSDEDRSDNETPYSFHTTRAIYSNRWRPPDPDYTYRNTYNPPHKRFSTQHTSQDPVDYSTPSAYSRPNNTWSRPTRWSNLPPSSRYSQSPPSRGYSRYSRPPRESSFSPNFPSRYPDRLPTFMVYTNSAHPASTRAGGNFTGNAPQGRRDQYIRSSRP